MQRYNYVKVDEGDALQILRQALVSAAGEDFGDRSHSFNDGQINGIATLILLQLKI